MKTLKMKTLGILTVLTAIISVFLVGSVSAGNLVSDVAVTFNDVALNSAGTTPIAGIAGEVVPVRVTFTAGASSEDVKVKIEIYGGREDYSDTTTRFNVVNGNVYTKLLSLQLPSDLKDVTKDLTLNVRIYDANNTLVDSETSYVVKMQRESYLLDFVSIDSESVTAGGEKFPVSIVIKNRGFQRSDDSFAVVSIPALGVSAKTYLGDLVAVENCDDDCEDAVQKTLYLQIPETATNGLYEMTVKVYDGDSTNTARKFIEVRGQSSVQLIAAVKSQDIKAGETKTFDLIIVNAADSLRVFNINAVSSAGLDVSVPSVITVGPDASQTVSVKVTADSELELGTYTVTVDVNGQKVVFTANVTGKSTASYAVVLTVVLVIIFVVLLAVLVALLLKKEKPIEEVETSYY